MDDFVILSPVLRITLSALAKGNKRAMLRVACLAPCTPQLYFQEILQTKP